MTDKVNGRTSTSRAAPHSISAASTGDATLSCGSAREVSTQRAGHFDGAQVDRAAARSQDMTTAKQKEGCVLWLTGLSGSGKSTLAQAIAPRLRAAGRKVEVLDGDVVRTHLSKGLGFSREDRDTNVARIAFVAHLLARNGVFVITAAISPFRSTRDAARALIGDFVEIHVAPPIEACIRRDVKGLYGKAIAGEIKEFTGISDPYEEPLSPELRLDTSVLGVDESVGRIFSTLRESGYLDAEPPLHAGT
jgi:adenylylsulfate kinase